jgi:hypothetical protein
MIIKKELARFIHEGDEESPSQAFLEAGKATREAEKRRKEPGKVIFR